VGLPSTTGPYGDFCTSRFFGGAGLPRFSSSTFANFALALRCCGVWACDFVSACGEGVRAAAYHYDGLMWYNGVWRARLRLRSCLEPGAR
jgi:hypothetical protein